MATYGRLEARSFCTGSSRHPVPLAMILNFVLNSTSLMMLFLVTYLGREQEAKLGELTSKLDDLLMTSFFAERKSNHNLFLE